MATVYRGTDERLDRTVAVKVMRPALADDPTSCRGSRARRGRPPGCPLPRSSPSTTRAPTPPPARPTSSWSTSPGAPCATSSATRGPLHPARALALLEPVLRALAAAHGAGLVHRDVKPENVLLADDGRVKVADFGLARAVETSGLTATTGLLIGTVAYLAPEQVEHGRADTRTDVYAAGILLFELLTGVPPYDAESPMSVAYRHVHDDVPAPSTAGRGRPRRARRAGGGRHPARPVRAAGRRGRVPRRAARGARRPGPGDRDVAPRAPDPGRAARGAARRARAGRDRTEPSPSAAGRARPAAGGRRRRRRVLAARGPVRRGSRARSA